MIGAAVPVVAHHVLCTNNLHCSKKSGVINGLSTLLRTSCYFKTPKLSFCEFLHLLGGEWVWDNKDGGD